MEDTRLVANWCQTQSIRIANGTHGHQEHQLASPPASKDTTDINNVEPQDVSAITPPSTSSMLPRRPSPPPGCTWRCLSSGTRQSHQGTPSRSLSASSLANSYIASSSKSCQSTARTSECNRRTMWESNHRLGERNGQETEICPR